ncbi:MAG: AAA family ATPase [Paracoccaceae bacterium]
MGPSAADIASSKLGPYRLGAAAFDTESARHFRGLDAADGPVLIRQPLHGQDRVRMLASYRFAAQISDMLDGAGALRCRDVLVDGSVLAMVLDPFDGQVLDQIIPSDGMGLDRLITASVGLARAIDALHLKGVAFQSLTPDSCMLSPDMSECRLISLETAVVLWQGAGTLGGDFAANPHYAAPELTGCLDLPVDFRADLYSLGACLFHMATGRTPFSAPGSRALAYAHVTQPVPDLAQLRPELPGVFCDIVTRLLQKDPEDRYNTAHGVLHDVSTCAAQFERSGTVRRFELAQLDQLSNFEISDKPYGRLEEIQTLSVACHLDGSEPRQSIIAISGPSGIGKTTVVDKMRVPLALADVQFITGKFDQFQRDTPYLAFSGAADNLARLLRVLDPEERLEILQTYRDAVGEYGGLLTELVPQLNELLGAQPEVLEVSPTEAQIRFYEVVGRFYRAMASRERPMVMFIDDLQWADHASLAILEALAAMPGLDYFTLILGYRSDEIKPGHPAHRSLTVMREKVAQFTDIEIGPLDVKDVRDIMRDALSRKGADIDAVAELVHGMSSGNPFFVREFLVSLRDRNLIRFDQSSGRWDLDMDAISDVSVPDSVAGMLTGRLQDMPSATLELLDTASCIGNSFDLRMLSQVSGRAMARIVTDLIPAIEGSLIMPLGSNQRLYQALGENDATGAQLSDSLGGASYRFRHDQARLAAHDRMSPGRKAQLHLAIGRLLLSSIGAGDLDAEAVEIFGHLEIGMLLIEDPDERLQVAQIGLDASRASRKGLAFATARAQLSAAKALLPVDAWTTQQDLKLAIESGLAECAFALADRDGMETAADEILDHISDPIKTTPLQLMRMGYLGTQNEHDAAASVAVDVAKTLGVSVPLKPSKLHVLGAALRSMLEQRGRDPRDHGDLPEASDPKIREAIELMATACPIAYFSDPNLLPLLGLTGTRLSIKHGLAPGSPYCFAVQALIYCGPLNRIEQGYKFGELALATAKRYGARDEARAHFVFNTFVRHWKHPLSEVAPELYGSWTYNRDAGDHENATYSAGVFVYADLFAGAGVDVDLRHPEVVSYLTNCDMPHIQAAFLSWIEVLRALRAPELGADLQGALHDYPAQSPTFGNKGVLISQCAMSAGVLDFYAGRHQRAEARFAQAQKFEENITAQVLVPALTFFRGLNAYRLAQSGEAGMLRMARACRRRMGKWMAVSDVNLAPRMALLDAEDCFSRTRFGDGLLHLNTAFDIAGQDAPMYAFLANARRADVLTELGKSNAAHRAAVQAVQDADRWGATAVANAFRHRFSLQLDTQTQAQDAEAMDIAEVLDTVGAIAQEQDRGDLLQRIMANAIRVTNADSGVLVQGQRPSDAQVQIVTDVAGQHDLGRPDLTQLDPVWAQAITECLATDQTLMSNDPTREFATTSQDQSDETKSLICVPIHLHNEVFGALCLANHHTRHVFSPGRVRLAQALGSQAGVALENAQLYTEIQAALQTQTKQAKANQRFVPETLLQALGDQTVTDIQLGSAVEQEMAVVFADIRGFTEITRDLGPDRTIEMINRYLSHVQGGIAANGGFVGNYMGDGLLALFPNRVDDALHGAIAMSRGLDGYNRDRGDFPHLQIGIGVNQGPVTLGMIGDEDHVQCGVLGDAVNICARIEALTKELGARCLISTPAAADLKYANRFVLRPLGEFTIQGQPHPIALSECLDVYPSAIQSNLMGTLPDFTKAVAAVGAGAFDDAIALFEACDARAGGDAVAAALAARCRVHT